MNILLEEQLGKEYLRIQNLMNREKIIENLIDTLITVITAKINHFYMMIILGKQRIRHHVNTYQQLYKSLFRFNY